MKKLILSQLKLAITCMIVAMLLIAGCTKDPVAIPETSPDIDEIFNDTGLNSDKSLTETTNILTDEEILSLMYMVEEVKLASDVYSKMLELYGLNVFDHVVQSELKHMDAISQLFEKYALVNPTTDNPAGIFVNEELQLLYHELVETGSVSKQEAMNVGVVMEEKLIQDVQAYLDFVVISKDIVQVYTHLLNSSQNHLATFVNKL